MDFFGQNTQSPIMLSLATGENHFLLVLGYTVTSNLTFFAHSPLVQIP